MDDFVRIPDYIDTYDDIMYVEYPTGDAEIVVGKKIDGYAVIIELVAGKRQALMFKQMRGMSDAKYKGMYKKRDPAYSGGVQAQTANATTSKPGKNLSAAKITPEREKVNADSANANREAVKQADNHPNRSSDALNRATDAAPPPTLSAALEALKTLGDTPAGRRARSAADAAAQAFRYIREAAQRSDEAAYATALGVLRHSAKELTDLAASGALPEDAARAAGHVAAKAKDLPGKAADLPVEETTDEHSVKNQSINADGEAIQTVIAENELRTYHDPMREKMGSAFQSHPKEMSKILKNLERIGVAYVSRPGSMSYSPGLRKGEPGMIIMDPEASYSAWLHELRHMEDDKAAGWMGFETFYDTEKLLSFEERAYAEEIDFARRQGYSSIVKRLERLRVERRQTILGKRKDHQQSEA